MSYPTNPSSLTVEVFIFRNDKNKEFPQQDNASVSHITPRYCFEVPDLPNGNQDPDLYQILPLYVPYPLSVPLIVQMTSNSITPVSMVILVVRLEAI